MTRVRDLMARERPRGPSFELVVLHVDHGLRGEGSRQDALFVARAAAGHRLPHVELRADPGRMVLRGRASEGRMRTERYRLLRQAACQHDLDHLYLAHHRDDRVESILLAALRGSGLPGLRGMPRRRPLCRGGPMLVRPLFEQSGSEIRAWLRRQGVPFRVDPSNDDLGYTRNQVRHLLLPRLREQLGARVDGQILRLGRLARLLWRRAERGSGRSTDILHAALLAAAGRPIRGAASRILQQAQEAGRRTTVTVGADLRIRSGPAGFETIASPPPLAPARIDLRILADRQGRMHRLLERLRRQDKVRLRQLLRADGRVYLDADEVELPLCIRTRQPGDRFQPLGMPHASKLKSRLIAARVPRTWRDQLVVLESPRGIVYAEGLAPAAGAALSGATRRVLRIRVRRTPPSW